MNFNYFFWLFSIIRKFLLSKLGQKIYGLLYVKNKKIYTLLSFLIFDPPLPIKHPAWPWCRSVPNSKSNYMLWTKTSSCYCNHIKWMNFWRKNQLKNSHILNIEMYVLTSSSFRRTFSRISPRVSTSATIANKLKCKKYIVFKTTLKEF